MTPIPLLVDAEGFQLILDWLNADPTAAETAGMKRLRDAKPPWQAHDLARPAESPERF